MLVSREEAQEEEEEVLALALVQGRVLLNKLALRFR